MAARRRATRTSGWLSVSALAAALAVVIGILTLFPACERRLEVPVAVDDRLQDLWEELLSHSPLPEPFAAVPSDDQTPALRIEYSRDVSADYGEDTVLLERRWLVPTVPLADPREEIDLEEVSGLELAYLDDVVPPAKGLAVDQLYPGDAGYPLIEDTVIMLETESLPRRVRDDEHELLRRWLRQMESETAPPGLVWIGAVGDIMPGRGVTEILDRSDGLHVVFGDLLPLLQSADLLIGNFEGAITTRGQQAAKSYTFRLHPRVLAPLRLAGFDYLSLTNNHSYDYGRVGFTDSLAHMADSGIATSGVGMSLEEASSPWVTSFGSTRVSVLSVGAYPVEQSGFSGAATAAARADRPGVLWAGGDGELYQAAIDAMERAFSDSSFDIVAVHGGREWASEPDEWQRERYASFVDAGADLVLGTHSHVVQGLEVHDGRIIAHSLGNFVFPGMYGTRYGEESGVLMLGLSGGTARYVRFYPVRINHQTLALDTATAIAERFFAATAALSRR